MSVPVHTDGREEVWLRTLARDPLQASHLLHTHSLESCHLRQEKAWLTASPPTPLHPQGLGQNALLFGKESASWRGAPRSRATLGTLMCQPFRAYHPYWVSACCKESLPLSQS